MKKLVLALFAAAAMIFGLAGCSGDLHDGPAKIIITIPASAGYTADSTLTIKNVGGNGVTVDGSLFSWCGGSAVKCTGFGPDFKVTATSTAANATWVSEQSPWGGTDTTSNASAGSAGSLPTGYASVKLSLSTETGNDKWFIFQIGGATTYENWASGK